jgi:cytochrome b561
MSVRTRYSHGAMLLHWIIAALILTNLVLGWRMSFLKGLAQFDMFQLHKSVGITVLVLSVLRLGWRLTHPAPALPTSMNRWERFGAHATHWFFYAMMIGMPLTGWAMVSVSAYNIPTLLWHSIPWPHIGFLHALPVGAKAKVEATSGSIHLYFAFAGAALIALHVAAALKHQFITKDGVLGRMVPGLASVPKSH